MKQCYRKHNLYVIKTLPKENLLVWNLKEGWEPLCEFLNLPIPQGDIPRLNQTGSSKFAKQFYAKNVFQESNQLFKYNIAVATIKLGLIGIVGWKVYKVYSNAILDNVRKIFKII